MPDQGRITHAIPAMLREQAVAGWLLYDFRHSNPLAYRVLGLASEGHFSRRWFYWIPVDGRPVKIVSALEAGNLDSLPGEKVVYRSWRELHAALRQVLPPAGRVAMEYSPMAAIPYVSRVDGGTLDLVRSLGLEVVSSADMIQVFEARLSPEEWASHRAAAQQLVAAQPLVAAHMATRLRAHAALSEVSVQTFLADYLAAEGMVADHPAIVAVNAHASNPHYAPSVEHDTPIQAGDLILIDFFARLDQPGAIIADYTWMYYAGAEVPPEPARVFAVAAEARDRAIAFVREHAGADEPLYAYQVDDVARGVIEAAGYGSYFIHRTGHSIGQETHGNGANIDNLETQDRRRLLGGSLFSIEPGIYLPTFGVRTEVDVYIGENHAVTVTGVLQSAIEPLL